MWKVEVLIVLGIVGVIFAIGAPIFARLQQPTRYYVSMYNFEKQLFSCTEEARGTFEFDRPVLIGTNKEANEKCEQLRNRSNKKENEQ